MRKETKQICGQCGKPVKDENRGSLTAWIFRPTRCTCTESKNPEPSLKQPRFRTPGKLVLFRSPSDTESADIASSPAVKNAPTLPEQTLVGKVLANKYHVLGFLGRGGMSSVYVASHLLLQKDVAIKVLRSHLLTDRESIERFKVEAKAVSALNSKHIIRLFDFDVTDELEPFLVVELLVGPSLADLVEQNPKGVLPDKAIGWFCQIASALQEAHEQGVIHRDLKPSNIAIDGDVAKIFDFGIAKVLYGDGNKQAKLTQTGDVFGSPMYMSPEQARGEKLDPRSDIYSFGCLMYEVLTGHPPIEADNIFDMLRKQMSEEPQQLSAVAPAVSESLNYVVMRCLSKSPSLRYQSAKQLLADLLHVKEHRKIPRELKKVSNYDSAQAIRRHDVPERVSAETIRMGVAVIAAVSVVGFCASAGIAYWAPQLPVPWLTHQKEEQLEKENFDKLLILARDVNNLGSPASAATVYELCLASPYVARLNSRLKLKNELEPNLQQIAKELSECYLRSNDENRAISVLKAYGLTNEALDLEKERALRLMKSSY